MYIFRFLVIELGLKFIEFYENTEYSLVDLYDFLVSWLFSANAANL